MDSSQFAPLRDQEFQKGSEQAFAPDAGVMHELKEAQVERQFLLRNAAMRSQPRAQQGPESLSGINMDFIKTVTVLIAGVFPPAMADRSMVKPPLGQAMVNVLLVGIHPRSRRDEPLNQRTDRGLLDVFEHPHDDRPASLDHPEDRGFFILQGAAPARTLQASPPPPAAFFLTASGCPLCPATI